MATVEQAIAVLKSQRVHLVAERDEEILRVELGLKAGGRKEVSALRQWYGDRVEVIDYVLNILEAKEEEPCPD